MQKLLDVETYEITREMIEAGASRLSELRGFDPAYAAEEVFSGNGTKNVGAKPCACNEALDSRIRIALPTLKPKFPVV
jgi:hypothetical protein